MWDYEKFFAIGNIVGTRNMYTNKIYNTPIDEYTNERIFYEYKNKDLTYKNCKVDVDYNVGHGYVTDFQIEYIIRLDENGEISKRIFDRKKDMLVEIPELKVGMFGKVLYYENGKFNDDYNNFGKFIVGIKDKIIYQNGGYDDLNEVVRLTKRVDDVAIVEIYDADYFKNCDESTLIWRNPYYQKFLDSKGGEKMTEKD